LRYIVFLPWAQK